MKTSCRAFTLIELLLVIAIIALTAGLAYAVMGPAREKARQTVCVSNLHQIGRALAMYQADYEGAEPVEGQHMYSWQLGLPIAGWPMTAFCKTYLKDNSVIKCPSYHGDPPAEKRHFTYQLGFIDYDEDARFFADAVMKHGPETPLAGCDQHNGRLDFGSQPRWMLKRVIVLRLNQQVQVKQVPPWIMDVLNW
jgi:prepilin-type N-terminal cleavage/methylation domain-containing protein